MRARFIGTETCESHITIGLKFAREYRRLRILGKMVQSLVNEVNHKDTEPLERSAVSDDKLHRFFKLNQGEPMLSLVEHYVRKEVDGQRECDCLDLRKDMILTLSEWNSEILDERADLASSFPIRAIFNVLKGYVSLVNSLGTNSIEQSYSTIAHTQIARLILPWCERFIL